MKHYLFVIVYFAFSLFGGREASDTLQVSARQGSQQKGPDKSGGPLPSSKMNLTLVLSHG
jgi:hypothetical protein